MKQATRQWVMTAGNYTLNEIGFFFSLIIVSVFDRFPIWFQILEQVHRLWLIIKYKIEFPKWNPLKISNCTVHNFPKNLKWSKIASLCAFAVFDSTQRCDLFKKECNIPQCAICIQNVWLISEAIPGPLIILKGNGPFPTDHNVHNGTQKKPINKKRATA